MDKTRKVVVITGASAGLGRATARAYGRRGARVGLLARGREGLDAARREIEDAGGEAIARPTDVSDAAQVESAVQAVEDRFGPTTFGLRVPWSPSSRRSKTHTPEEFKRVTEVTYLGVVCTVRSRPYAGCCRVIAVS
jgi:NADP-dependent 3-hydroxy acid dehydrogenase YdfG